MLPVSIQNCEASFLTNQSDFIQSLVKQDYQTWFRRYPLDYLNHLARKILKIGKGIFRSNYEQKEIV